MSGLKASDNFEEVWEDLEKYVGSLQDMLTDESKVKSCLKEIGTTIKQNVTRYAPRPSANPSYSDFKASEYKHIIDDIKFVVKKSKETGQYYVSVRGGKATGYKWLWVNDGHVTQSGDFVQGTHFVDKAEEGSTEAVNKIVDRYIKEALGKK